MEIELQKIVEELEKNINKLITDFSCKKEKYYTDYIKLSWAIAISSACVSFFLGISFVDGLTIPFRVLALLFSSVLLVLNGAMGFLNYKNLYEQRTKTLVRLLSLRRELRLVKCGELTYDLLKEIYDKLENIMQEDLSEWIENVPKTNE